MGGAANASTLGTFPTLYNNPAAKFALSAPHTYTSTPIIHRPVYPLHWLYFKRNN